MSAFKTGDRVAVLEYGPVLMPGVVVEPNGRRVKVRTTKGVRSYPAVSDYVRRAAGLESRTRDLWADAWAELEVAR
ncbi:hypothetical protein RCO28_12420 [Streptomyces sp. LHD-70]|uniref:hypothetical protein n=1 Tax=Streptomyces sp. LHD-70 TaxID=3072140 RepID=UPI00280E2E2A|nr:hypothetical protein [Streptomyces sp. LHD-70]MDQ8703286.1 hypothetical protein [Streptomyces sp. LHD-70]